MENREKKSCLDCLHCKASAKPAENRRLCYCAKGKKESIRREPFWLAKKVCKDFESMD